MRILSVQKTLQTRYGNVAIAHGSCLPWSVKQLSDTSCLSSEKHYTSVLRITGFMNAGLYLKTLTAPGLSRQVSLNK